MLTLPVFGLCGMTPFRRPFLPCLLAYVAGLWLAREAGGLGGGWLAGSVLAGAAAALGWAAVRRDATPLLLAACAAFGVLRMETLLGERRAAREAVRRLDDNIPRVVRGTVRTVAEDDPFQRTRLVLESVTVTSAGQEIALPGRMSVTLSDAQRRDDADITPGDRVRLLAAVAEPPGYRNFFGHNHTEYLALRRIYASARVHSGKLVQREASADDLRQQVRHGLARVRSGARAILFRHMPGHEALLMEVLLFNDMRLLSDTDERVFRDSGTMHLFAVSGTHIGLLALILIALFRAARLSVRVSWTAAAVLLFFYVWLLDFVAPALRALLMLAGFVAGKWLGREVDGISSLAFGAGMILLADPAAAWQAGFLLSLMGVIAILVFVPLGRQWLGRGSEPDRDREGGWFRLKDTLRDGAVLSLAVVVVLLPLQFFFFLQMNLLSPLANFLEGLFAILVLAAGIAVVGAGAVAPVAADHLGASAALLMRLSYRIAEITAAQEWAIVRMAQPPLAVVVGYYVVLFSGYYMTRRDTPEFRPKSRARFCVHFALGVALLAGAAQWDRLMSRPLRIWFFDVGQGDSTLIQFPSGQSLLVDAGHVTPDLGRLVVGPQLRALGVWPLDELVATHADADHIGGIPWLLHNHRVGRLVEGTNSPPRDALITALNEACSATAVRRLRVTAGESVRLDDRTTVEVLNPPSNPPPGSSNNDQSVVLRIRHGKFSALLMADAEGPVEERLVNSGIGRCDVLKVGHHGSRTSSGAGFLNAVRPAVAVISCGRRNHYGHPHPRVLARLDALGCRTLRTDLHGAVLVESDGESYRVITARE